MRRLSAAALLSVVITYVASAAPPPGADPKSPLGRWVLSMRNTIRGAANNAIQGCCSFSDCRPTAVETTADGRIMVWIGKSEFGPDAPDAWLEADEHAQKAISDGDPPDGRSWACFYGGMVQCWRGGTGG